MLVLIGCEESQAICKAFRERGHEAYSCDIQPCSGNTMEALHYILLAVIAAAFLYIRYERKRRRRIREHDLYRDQLFKSLRQREMAIINRTMSGTPKSSRPMPPPPPPSKKVDENDYIYPYLWTDTNPGYTDSTPSHHEPSAPDHGDGGDFGGGGSTDSWGGSDSGSSDSGSSYND